MTEDYKISINEFLFQILDERTTIRELEDMACAIYAMIRDSNNKVRNDGTKDDIRS